MSKHRLTLWRDCGFEAATDARPMMVIIGLNPSTADETTDDPTIRRCIQFAAREGCRLTMLNLFTARATNPKDLWAMSPAERNHPDADFVIAAQTRSIPQIPGSYVVAAWGVQHNPAMLARVVDVVTLVNTNLWCLGTTLNGSPRHPLYLRANSPLKPWWLQ